MGMKGERDQEEQRDGEWWLVSKMNKRLKKEVVLKPKMVTHTGKPSTWEAGRGRLQVPGQPEVY